MSVSTYQPWKITAGVQPSTDSTAFDTQNYTFSDKIRFVNNRPEKIGGWISSLFNFGQSIMGVPRSLWSTELNQQTYTLIGTESRLYCQIGSVLTNITPLSANSLAAPNSISTNYDTLGANPLSVVNGSSIVTVTDPKASLFQIGDAVVFSGASAVGGIPAASINGTQIIRMISGSNYTFFANTNATSTTNGGGSITRSSGLVRVTSNNTLVSGDRVKIANAASFTATSATPNTAGSGYKYGDVLTESGGSYGTQAKFTVATTKAISGNLVNPGSGSFVPGDTLTATGGTFSTAATFTLANTQVISATVAAAGTGGANGTQTVTGTTGTGTRFQASVTVSGGAITQINSITLAGNYTANPASISAEPVIGGGLTGATLNIRMGILAFTGPTVAGNYTANPNNPVLLTDSSGGTGATLNISFGVNTVTVLNAGQYYTTPPNPVDTTTDGSGSGSTLNITYSGIGSVGGITAQQLNREFIARNITPTYYDVYTSGTSSSSTTGGGTSTVYYAPIASGNVNEQFGQGYGMGLYGTDLYGTARLSPTGKSYPRIWFFDRYGDYMMMTAGNGTALYEWTGDLTTAPTPVPNSPAQINYFFVSNNIIVTFGNAGFENRITSSDISNRTIWTTTAQNQSFDGFVQNAGRLISHISVQGLNLIFTEKQTYTFRYLGLPNIWEIKLLSNVGIISAFAGQAINGVAYWQGLENFYQWGGGNIKVLGSDTQNTSTILNYTFDNLNFSQKSKCFSWYYKYKQEMRWHYPVGSGLEPTNIACTNLADQKWWPDTINRVSAERPASSLDYPRLCSFAGSIYIHEYGTDDDGVSLPWTVTTNMQTSGKEETFFSAFIPDNDQSSDISVTLKVQQFPQSATAVTVKSYTVSKTDGRYPIGQTGRFNQYTISGNALGQYWRMGQWAHETQPAGDGK